MIRRAVVQQPSEALAGRPRGTLPRRRARRAFTLVEIMLVLAIIGVLVAVATPKMTHLIADRRVEEVTKQTARAFTQARVRSLARGTATLFRFTAAGGTGLGAPTLEIRESVAGGADLSLPGGSCFAANWTNGSQTSQGLMVSSGGPGNHFTVEFLDDQGAVRPFAEVCFTPRGRSYIRYAPNGVFAPVTFVPRIRVTNTRSARERIAFLPATGVGRIQL